MASFNTGTTGSATSITQATAFTFTVPAGVATGDVMIVVVSNFTFTSSSPAHSTPTSGGGSWTQIGTLQDTGATGGLNEYSTLWYRVATGSDPSSTFSMTFTGTQGAQNHFWWSACLGSYTGFFTPAPIGAFATNKANNVGSPYTGPTTTTTLPNSWRVEMLATEVGASGSINGEPATNRELSNPGAGINSALSDSNGSVGAAGTSIGGGTWTFSHTTSGNQPVGWIVELCTVGTPTVAQSLATVPIARRRLARVVTGFIPVTTVNVGNGPAGTVQPITAQAAPRRRPSRAVVGFIPVTTTNNLHPPVPQQPPTGGGKSMLSRYMRWADL